MRIFPLSSGPFETNGYVVAESDRDEAYLIDAPPGSLEIYKRILKREKLVPKALLLTHSHWDHTADTVAITEDFLIPVYVHSLDAENVKRPGSDRLPLFFTIEGKEPDFLLEEGQVLSLGSLELKVIHTPGHTPGGVCFYLKKDKILFSGDTLFRGTIGNLSFPTAQPEKMWDSLKKLSLLPHRTVVYPGHGPKTTIGEEKFLNDPKSYFS
jgi:glyoxylase-like metal-dependent hydrolase (beta-lactamase superfamily II)